MTDYVIGPDLNRYRPDYDIAKVKAAGGRFVIGKATEVWPGTKWEDPTYQDYKKQTKEAGLPFGAYFYWRAEVDPEEQVDWYFEVVKKHIDFPPIIDVERTNNIGKLSPDAAHDSLLACVTMLLDVYNVLPWIYTSWWSWKSLLNDSPLIKTVPLWVANFTAYSKPLLPVGAEDWDMWQFTSSYPWPGQSHTADANRYPGTEAQLNEFIKVNRSLMYPEAPPPEPPPDPTTQSFYLELGGDKWVGEAKKV